ncbi:MAG: diguanylate cyclase [Ideonella sp.]
MNFFPAVRRRLAMALGSLKLRITVATIAALALGIGLTTVTLVQRTERDTLTAVRERELSEATRTASAVSRQVVELQRALIIAASSFKAEVLDSEPATDRFLSDLPILRTMFSSLFIVDANGRMRALIDGDGISHPKLDLVDRAYFRRALTERRPIVSEVLPSRYSGEPIIVFAQPLTDANGAHRAHGILAGSLNLVQRDLLIDLVSPDDGGNSDTLRVVADGQGRILAHPDRSLLLSKLSDDPRLAAAAKRWQDSGSPIEPNGLTIGGTTGVVTAGGVSGPDWVVWRVVSEHGLFAPLHSARRHALELAVVLIALSSALMLLGSWWLLRPLKRVQERALQMFDSGIDPQLGWPSVAGEIGHLADVLRQIGVERSRLEVSNTHLLQQLGSVMRNAPVGIAFTRDKQFELVSAECCLLLGRTERELLGQPTHIIYDSRADFDALGPKVVAAFAAGTAFVGDIQMRRGDGTRFWAHLRGRPVDAADSASGTIWTLTDVTEEVTARTELEWAAHHDALTGLANRQAFEIRLRREFAAQPHALSPTLMLIDLDHFKQINDSAGHAAGDAVLCAVANALLDRMRSRDLVARMGGDEFAILLDHCPRDAAHRLATDLCEAIAAIQIPSRSNEQPFGASIGIAELHTSFSAVESWLYAADKACYEAKAAGRGQFRVAPLRRDRLRVVSAV